MENMPSPNIGISDGDCSVDSGSFFPLQIGSICCDDDFFPEKDKTFSGLGSPSRRMVSVEIPSSHDVLSGRGKRVNNHKGNVHFRQLCQQYKNKYYARSTSCEDKHKIVDTIVTKIHSLEPRGRFLEYNEGINIWTDIDDKRAKRKTMQVMREFSRTKNPKNGNSFSSKYPKKMAEFEVTTINNQPSNIATVDPFILTDFLPQLELLELQHNQSKRKREQQELDQRTLGEDQFKVNEYVADVGNTKRSRRKGLCHYMLKDSRDEAMLQIGEAEINELFNHFKMSKPLSYCNHAA